MAVRHLYLARHAEPDAHGTLSERGMRQAALLGRRLAHVPLDAILHGPLPRAVGTAQVVARQLSVEVPGVELGAAGDYVPYVPDPDEVGPEYRAGIGAFLSGVSAKEAAQGAGHAAEAIRLFTGPGQTESDSHLLVVTHAFTIGWLVRHAYGAPAWRWIGLDHCHAALTVIRYDPDRPPAVAVLNDMSHLPDDLRWTGFPAHLRL